MHRILLRLLLLAVFFNTAVGMPAHTAKHLAHAEMSCAWLADSEEDTHAEAAHGLCAWCVAHAQPADTQRAAAMHVAAPAPAAPAARSPAAFVPGPGRWPFASRDPPARA